MGKKAKKVTDNAKKKGGQTMAQTAEEKRKQEQDELQKQQDQDVSEEVDDEETSQGDDEGAKDQDDEEEEKTPFIQRVRILAAKVLKILIKWVLKPLAIAIVVFASMISLIVNLGGKDQQDESGDDVDSDDPGEEDAPEEEFEDESDSDDVEQAE